MDVEDQRRSEERERGEWRVHNKWMLQECASDGETRKAKKDVGGETALCQRPVNKAFLHGGLDGVQWTKIRSADQMYTPVLPR